jgi:hypothetical protein
MLAALVGLWFGVRMLRGGSRQYVWCLGASAAVCLALFLRPVGPCVLAALLAALWLRPGGLRRWRSNLLHSAVLTGPLVVAAGLWALRCLVVTGGPGTTYIRAFITDGGLSRFVEHWFRSVGKLVVSLGDTITGVDLELAGGVVLLVPILVGLVVAWRRRERLITLYGIIYLAAICVANPGRRYLMPALPMLAFWLVLGGSEILRFLGRRCGVAGRHRIAVVAAVLVAMLVACNLLRISKLVYEARSPDFYSASEGQHTKDLFDLAAWLRQNARPDDIVLAREDRFLHYFTRVRTCPTGKVRYGTFLRRFPISLVVRDPEDPALEQMDFFLAEDHRALKQVASFGELRVLRIDRDKLLEEDQ